MSQATTSKLKMHQYGFKVEDAEHKEIAKAIRKMGLNPERDMNIVARRVLLAHFGLAGGIPLASTRATEGLRKEVVDLCRADVETAGFCGPDRY